MTRYRIIPQRSVSPFTVDEEKLLTAVANFTGRSALAIPSVRRRLRETGRVFIAGRTAASGVIVEKIAGNSVDTDEGQE